MEKGELLAQYQKGLGSEGKTRRLYLRYAQDFLDYGDGSFERETVLKFLDRLKRKKYSDGTLNFVFRVIRTLYNRNSDALRNDGIDWPFRRGETPQIRENKIVAPALDPDIIIEMIEKMLTDGSPEEKAFLALSTTFGLRREEMLELEPSDISIRDRSIHVKTLKHGRERTHLIPDQIVPALEGYSFANHFSEFALLGVWYRIEWKTDFPHQDQVGWHSIRRTLNTLLMDQLPENTVMSFLRWKQRTSSHMPFRYSAQTFIGRDTTATRVIGEAKDVDSKVFQVHPFIKYWR